MSLVDLSSPYKDTRTKVAGCRVGGRDGDAQQNRVPAALGTGRSPVGTIAR